MSRQHDTLDRRYQGSASHPQPYHAVSEVYLKEVTHHPIGPASEYPPRIIDILKEEPRAAPHTPPLVRSRETTGSPEPFPIVRVPSAQFTDVLTEIYDYHETEKYTRRSVTPDYEPLRRQPEILEQKAPRKSTSKHTVPTYKVIPPTPEKHTPRHQPGIPLTSPTIPDSHRYPEEQRRPLPIYEEYMKIQKEENRNVPILVTRHRSRSRSPLTSSATESEIRNHPPINNNNIRHIDSSSSDSTDVEVSKDPQNLGKRPEDVGERYVYSHDVYVDSTTGRPFTPGREDVSGKRNCDRLKINVYFKPPHPLVEATYKLDEIEIEKQEDIRVPKLRPSRSSTILSRSESSNPSDKSNSSETSEKPIEMETRRIPTRISLLRKEHEVLTVPLQSLRHSRLSEHGSRPQSKTTNERSIPIYVEETSSINIDEVFPKMPLHQNAATVNAPSHHSTRDQVKGDYPRQQRISSVAPHHRDSISQRSRTPEHGVARKTSKSPSDGNYKIKRPSEYSPSFNSHHHKSERTPSEVRIPVTITPTIKPQIRAHQKRESPEELDYGRFPVSEPFAADDRRLSDEESCLPYTRGISKTPSDKDYNAYRSQGNKSPSPTGTGTPVLKYTRGISKTPSDRSYRDERIPSCNDPLNGRGYQQSPRPVSPKRTPHRRTHSPKSHHRSPSAKPKPSAPSPSQGPFEEVVHIKERYERDETIRRFFPTTTAV